MKKITIKDVAAETGMAISTVSNALNGSELVTEETRAKVLAAAKKLNYVPNISGRLLKSRKSNRLCFITSSIRGEYFIRLLDTINDRCTQHHYSLDIIITRDRETVLNDILGGMFDGFFLFEGNRLTSGDLENFCSKNIKCVMLDRKYENSTIGSVVFDSYHAGYEVTKHLINLGHRKIGFVDASPDNYDCVERKRGYYDALLHYQIPIDEHYNVMGDFDEDIAYSAMLIQAKRFPNDMPSAYVCGDDKSAIGAMRALIMLGYKVPEDISIVGFDDIELAKYFQPALTTVRNPIEEQGRCAADLLLELIGSEKPGYSRVLSGRMVPRESSGIAL